MRAIMMYKNEIIAFFNLVKSIFDTNKVEKMTHFNEAECMVLKDTLILYQDKNGLIRT